MERPGSKSPAIWRLLHYRVVAGVGEGMAAHDSGEGHPSSAQGAVALDGFHGVFGTRRHVAAGWRKQGRDGPFVGSQQLQRDEFGGAVQDRLSASGVRLSGPLLRSSERGDNFCSITAKARVTSFKIAAKSAVRSDFFGLITTSAARLVGGCDKRTASRRRRFMRLRSTAPPRARLTVKPTRRACGAASRARVPAPHFAPASRAGTPAPHGLPVLLGAPMPVEPSALGQ